MRYRADIDGLRAIAVSTVVAYHAFPDAMPGGFVGVDVFFVISGFLIASLIDEEHSVGRFRLGDFYGRRVRRILPALLVVCGAVAAAGAFLFLPDELRDLGQSLAAAMVFVSNILFWSESGYFETSAALKPLLHTWSLGVEEQFYLAWPLIFLLLAARSRQLLLAGAAALLALSLWISAHSSAAAPDFAFFMLPSRLWELLLGVLLALSGAPRLQLPRWLAELAVGSGLAAILTAAAGVGTAPLFPMPGALLPCLGAALVILGGAQARLTVLPLTTPPAVGLGRISYSLYLWHWPVLVFAGYVLVRELRPAEAAAAILLSVVLAILSWRFVEQPARRPHGAPVRVCATAGVVSTILLLCGVGLHLVDGWPQRIRPEVLALADHRHLVHDGRDCHFASRRVSADGLCVRGASDASPTWLLLGDSHADMYSPVIFAELERQGLAGIQLTDSGYLPGPAHLRMDAVDRYVVNHALLNEVLSDHPGIRSVIVGQFWRQAWGYALSDPDGRLRHGAEGVRDALQALIRAWPDRRFVVLGPIPDSPAFGPNAAARGLRFGGAALAVDLSVAEARASEAETLLADLARMSGVTFLPMLPAICAAELCPNARDGRLLYRDNDHLSVDGAWLAAPALGPALEPAPLLEAKTDTEADSASHARNPCRSERPTMTDFAIRHIQPDQTRAPEPLSGAARAANGNAARASEGTTC